MKRSQFFLLFLLLSISAATSAAGKVAAVASVDSPSMSLGQTNAYTITLKNSSETPRWDPPEVPGLVFSRTPATHSSMQFFNGVTTQETKITWRFQASQTGSYTIPGRELEVGGNRVQVDPVAVEVGEMPAEMRNRFALRWKLPDGPFYVGQTIPATLQLFVRSGINAGLASAPEGSNEQFLVADFPQNPRQSQQMIGNQLYVLVEWDTLITPIRSGHGQLPVRLALSYETGQIQRGFFGNQPVQEQIVLTTDEQSWPVKDLPAAGRPDSFSGAVGQFEVSGELARNEIEIGQPVTFSVKIQGEGNFPRISAPPLESTAGWRTHPPRAKMSDESTDFRGSKSFEYIFIPTTESITETPPIAFSWFDPHEESWKEIELPPEPVSVFPRSDESNRTETAQRIHQTPAAEPLEIATSIGPHRTFSSPLKEPIFWVVNGGLSSLLAFAAFGIVMSKRSNHPALRKRANNRQAARRLTTDAVRAARAENAEAFYSSAREALRLYLDIPATQTGDELASVLAQNGLSEETAEKVRHLFARKESFDFARWRPSSNELQTDCEQLQSIFEELKKTE